MSAGAGAAMLIAVALLVAPWRGPAGERLAELGEPRSPQAGGRGRSGPVGHLVQRLGLLLGPRLRAALPRRSPRPPAPAQLARLVDLLASALLAGLPTADALDAVADAMDGADAQTGGGAGSGVRGGDPGGGGLADPLRAAAARVRLGADPAAVWAGIPGAGALGPVAGVLARATAGGGSVRAALEHAAQRLRAEADAAAVSRAERAAVLVAGPLGLCFLPAFVCLGVVPVVIGLADGMLPGVLP